MLEEMSVYLHHDAITGTERQYVADDYTFRMQSAIDKSNILYKQELERALYKQTGIEALGNLTTCIGSQNDTVTECPVSFDANKDFMEFIVIVHNPSNKPFK